MGRPPVRVSEHAQQRIKQRLGLPKRAMLRLAQLALERGMPHRDFPPGPERYRLDQLHRQNAPDGHAEIFVHGEHIFVFTTDTPRVLVTVYPLKEPQEREPTFAIYRRRRRNHR